MADEENAQSTGAPTAAVPRAPVAQPPAKAKRARKASGSGNRGGRRKLTDEEKQQRERERQEAITQREQSDQQREQTRRQMARIASIGALTPHLLEPQEVSALARFVLATVQGVAPAAPEEQG